MKKIGIISDTHAWWDDSRPKLFVCGHSHILKVMPDRSLGCLVVNPGAAGVQGWQVVRTLVTLTLDNGNITHAQVIELAK